MTIQLLKGDTPVLTARTKHQRHHGATSLPVSYEGDTSLLPPNLYTDDILSSGDLETIFTRIAREHGLEMAGDYHGVQTYGSVDFTGYPPEPGYEEEEGDEKPA